MLNKLSVMPNSPLSSFTVFGFSRDPSYVKGRLTNQLGITPHTFQIGSLGQFFLYTSFGDVAESDEAVVFKLGFLRSTTKSALTAPQLLAQKLVEPRTINADAFSGNGLVVGFSKTEPVFSAFQTLMSVPQLYYSVSSDGILCSDVLRNIVNSLPSRELNEAVLPQHYLFRSVYGSSTYFRGVNRLIPGHYLKWTDGDTEIRLLRNLDAVSDETQYIRNDSRALNLLCESLEEIVGDYVTQVEASGQRLATLLSGGIDSSLIQYFINTKSSQQPIRSISFNIQVPAFEFESGYARQLSQLLHTDHTFVDYTSEQYPELLTRVIDILAQPPNFETEPSFLSVAEFVQASKWAEKYFITGQGGDTLFGGESTTKLKGLHVIRRIPYIIPLLKGLGKTLAPITRHSTTLLKGAEIIANAGNPDAYISPENNVCVYVLDENRDIIQRCFGDRALREALAYRRNLVAQYSNSQHYIDKVYFIDLVTDLWELGVQRQTLFLAHNLEQASPFFDEDIIKLALTFHPDMRYIKGFKYKHLLKRLLAKKTNAPVAHLRKGPSTVNDDLVEWMRSGPLRPMVEDISRPDFMCKADFERLIRKPDYFVWPLLTFDLFRKRIIENQGRSVLQD